MSFNLSNMSNALCPAGRFLAGLFLLSSLALSGCDFGNNTSDTTSTGAEEGTIQQGDNADDKRAETEGTMEDTTGVGSFQ